MIKKAFFTIFAVGFLTFTSCLDPFELDPSEFDINFSGNITMTDVTSAVFLLSNRSKTVDVTEINIIFDETEWNSVSGSKPARDGVTVLGIPKRSEQKAQYVQPSDISYRISVTYHDSNPKEGKSPQGIITFKAPMSIPRQVYEYHLFKDINGDVQIVYLNDDEKNLPGSDPNDTVKETKPEQNVGEGSSPAVIPPENRNRMGTVIVVDMTNSQNIAEAAFTQGEKTFILGTVNAADKRSIALGQGDWQVSITYNRNNTIHEVGPKNIIIVPSNDPQAVKEHYLYFYLNDKGEYTFVTGNPPTDANDKDIIPPDSGYGSGVIVITNNSSAMAISTTVRNLNDDLVQNYYYRDNFIPQRPIQYGQTGYINVIGSSEFPLQNHNRYLVSVDLEAVEGIVTVQRLAYLNSVVYIQINEEDIKNPNTRVGVTLRLTNNHHESIITGLVLEDQNGRMLAYGMNSWGHEPVRENGGIAYLQVLTTSNVPIHENSYFVAHLTLQYSGSDPNHLGKTAVAANLPIDPSGNLYGNPANTERFVTLNPDDIEWSKVSPSVLPPSVTMRFYGIGSIDPITAIILIRDKPASAGFNETSPDFGTAGKSALPHTSLRIWETGHTKVPFTSYFDTNTHPAMVTRKNFYDFKRVEDAVRDNRVVEIAIPGGLAQDKTRYVDITMALPDEGEGWYAFFLTSLGWVIGHTNPPFNAPNRLQNTLFWINPNRLMDGGYWIEVDNNYYQATAGGNRPRRVEPGAGFKVIPIGHHINDDTTSILKRPASLPVLGPLLHDAASTTDVNSIRS
ncbi:MAG: hypothetical protein FWG77_07990 [Treponema sp.]|nr:hypothetical protein [Treponema sp.]